MRALFSFIVNLKAMISVAIGTILALLAIMTGYFTFMCYAVLIFEESDTYINPYYSSIVLAIAQIIGSLCSTQLSDTLGRKILMIISLFGPAMGLFVLTIYLYLMETGVDLSSFKWVPVTSLSFVIFIASAGIVPLASVYTVEILPAKVRSSNDIVFFFPLTIITIFLSFRYEILVSVYAYSFRVSYQFSVLKHFPFG